MILLSQLSILFWEIRFRYFLLQVHISINNILVTYYCSYLLLYLLFFRQYMNKSGLEETTFIDHSTSKWVTELGYRYDRVTGRGSVTWFLPIQLVRSAWSQSSKQCLSRGLLRLSSLLASEKIGWSLIQKRPFQVSFNWKFGNWGTNWERRGHVHLRKRR